MVTPDELARLYADVEWAKEKELPDRELKAALERLYKAAIKESDYHFYAVCSLSAFIVKEYPFRALRLCQEGLAYAASAELECTAGIAHLLLDHDNSAESAFRRALDLEPENISCLHNLGHLLDLVRGKPVKAVGYLSKALELAPYEPELMSSLAHTVLQLGEEERARELLSEALDGDSSAVERYLRSWKSAKG